jgi:hypothetical protein
MLEEALDRGLHETAQSGSRQTPVQPEAAVQETLPARLAAHDMTYHRRVVTEEVAAQELLLQAQIRSAKSEAVASSWWAYLKDVYVLVEEDTVAPDGTISRVPRVGSPVPSGDAENRAVRSHASPEGNAVSPDPLHDGEGDAVYRTERSHASPSPTVPALRGKGSGERQSPASSPEGTRSGEPTADA